MATINLSANGQAISRSYQTVVDAPPPTGASASSPTHAQWAVFTVSTPLSTAFQQDSGGKESVLKVQSSGDGELTELIDEFSDGRVQFAFVKVKDPNTSLPKFALIAWCGEGVPERTKGYFTSHLAAVSRVLQGYHVQITARSDRDLTPEGIVQKVSDASGSRYSGAPSSVSGAPPPKPASKPVFMPTQSSGAGSLNPLGRTRQTAPKQDVDVDGWGADAPPVTRTQLEKVQPAYQPTKVAMPGMASQQETGSVLPGADDVGASDRPGAVRGAYQPVGKVDIAAIRREAAANSTADNRPTPVKGAYEPVGKVDIAAIKARAQPAPGQPGPVESALPEEEAPKPVSARASAFSQPERLTDLPKPKVANRFGAPQAFTGTKAPLPGGAGAQTGPAVPPVGASRTFADEGGKTPAQLWAEKKNKGGIAAPAPSVTSPGITAQNSGGNGWKSGYTGKSWAAVQTSKTGQSAASLEGQSTGPEQEDQTDPPSGGRVGALREAIGGSAGEASGATQTAPAPPPLETSTKPNATTRGVPMPGLPFRPDQSESHMPVPPSTQPRSPTPEEDEPDSPIRIAMPVSQSRPAPVEDAHEEQEAPPPPMPARALAQETARYDDEQEDEPERADPARAAGLAVASSHFGEAAAATAPAAAAAGHRALVQFDYEKGEDNEIDLAEGEYVIHIDMVDDDWWMGQNARGESGLFPSNYVELVEDGEAGGAVAPVEAEEHAAPAHGGAGPTATALYDYEAGEDNELSFPEGGKVTDVAFPDDDWWSGSYGGREGLFPSNYVQLDE